MGVLSFKVFNEIKSAEVEIADELGNTLVVPSKGTSDYKEYQVVMQKIIRSQQNSATMANAEIDIVLCCLRYRFNISSSVPDEEILQMPDGSPMGVSMLKKLVAFFSKELGLDEMQQQAAQAPRFEDAAPYLEKPKKGFGGRKAS